MRNLTSLTPCLWYDRQAEEAAEFYCGIFKDSKMGRVMRFGNEGQEIHGGAPGAVLSVEFELDGHPFLAMNGGPLFKFNEAVSFQIGTRDQDETDYYTSRLIAGGGEQSNCGWLKDKFGLSWQVTPSMLPKMLCDSDRKKADRVMKAMLQMRKIDIAKLEEAYHG